MAPSKLRILVVAPEKGERRAIEHALRDDSRFEPVCVATAAEARARLASSRFAVVLAADTLGEETATDLVSCLGGAGLAVTSRSAAAEDAVRAMRAGACDYVVKDAGGAWLEQVAERLEQASSLARRQSESRILAQAVAGVRDAIFIADAFGNLVFVNDGFCRTYGYARDQVLGRPCDFLGTGAHPCDATGDISGEMEHRRADGTHFPVSLTRTVVRDRTGAPQAVVTVARDITERRRNAEERERLFRELQLAFAEVKRLSGFLPICMRCKKIRDDEGYWREVEQYIRERSDAEFTHGLCPDCEQDLYPDL